MKFTITTIMLGAALALSFIASAQQQGTYQGVPVIVVPQQPNPFDNSQVLAKQQQMQEQEREREAEARAQYQEQQREQQQREQQQQQRQQQSGGWNSHPCYYGQSCN